MRGCERWGWTGLLMLVASGSGMLLAREASACSPSFPPTIPTAASSVGLETTPPIIREVGVERIVRDLSPREGGGDGCGLAGTRVERGLEAPLFGALALLAHRRRKTRAGR